MGFGRLDELVLSSVVFPLVLFTLYEFEQQADRILSNRVSKSEILSGCSKFGGNNFVSGFSCCGTSGN
jgi:hypothetical protein